MEPPFVLTLRYMLMQFTLFYVYFFAFHRDSFTCRKFLLRWHSVISMLLKGCLHLASAASLLALDRVYPNHGNTANRRHQTYKAFRLCVVCRAVSGGIAVCASFGRGSFYYLRIGGVCGGSTGSCKLPPLSERIE